MLNLEKIWSVVKPDYELRQRLAQTLGISPIVAQILINRGIQTEAEARCFLECDLRQLPQPWELAGVREATRRILAAIGRGEKILVYGDYDVDGITATSLMVTVLKRLGATVDYYVPDRLEEGYGLNQEALRAAWEGGARVVITVDCGITSLVEADYARQLGLELLITDHHEPATQLPEAPVVINPKLGYSFQELAGVGVAFKLAQGLLAAVDGEQAGFYGEELLDLVALGTVADIVPLTGENRVLVKHGLRVLAGGGRVGLQELIKATGLDTKEITTWHLSFILAPRLNATGRVGDPRVGAELLLTESHRRAQELIIFLEQTNLERQALEKEVSRQAEEKIAAEVDLAATRVLVLAGAGWHPGVIGIVASRLADKYNRPVFLIAVDGEIGKGSGRSQPGFSLFAALERCQSLLIKYGGHSQAAGLTIAVDQIEAFRSAINQVAEQLAVEEHRPSLDLDAEVGLTDLDWDLLEQLAALAPFGNGNASPLLVCRGTRVVECRGVGNGGSHLKLKIRGDNGYWDGIGFRLGSMLEVAAAQESLDLAFSLEANEWNGKRRLQLKIKDLRPAGSALLQVDELQPTWSAEGPHMEKLTGWQRLAWEQAEAGLTTLVVSALPNTVELLYRQAGQLAAAGLAVGKAYASQTPCERAGLWEILDGSIPCVILTTHDFLAYYIGKFHRYREKIGLVIQNGVDCSAEISQLGQPKVIFLTSPENEPPAYSWRNFNSLETAVTETAGRGPSLFVVGDERRLGELTGVMFAFGLTGLAVLPANSDPDRCQSVLARLNAGELRTLVLEEVGLEQLPQSKWQNLIWCGPPRDPFGFFSQTGRIAAESANRYLVISPAEATAVEQALIENYPEREVLGRLYLTLKEVAATRQITAPWPRLVDLLALRAGIPKIPATLRAGLTILNDLGLINWRNGGGEHSLELLPPPGDKLNLTASPWFREGERVRQAYAAWRECVGLA